MTELDVYAMAIDDYLYQVGKGQTTMYHDSQGREIEDTKMDNMQHDHTEMLQRLLQLSNLFEIDCTVCISKGVEARLSIFMLDHDSINGDGMIGLVCPVCRTEFDMLYQLYEHIK